MKIFVNSKKKKKKWAIYNKTVQGPLKFSLFDPVEFVRGEEGGGGESL